MAFDAVELPLKQSNREIAKKIPQVQISFSIGCFSLWQRFSGEYISPCGGAIARQLKRRVFP